MMSYRPNGALRRWLPLVLSMLFPAPGLCDADLSGMVGTWHGASTCVNREAAPACNDEQVVYEIAAVPGKQNTVTVKADKVIDGKRVPMGILDFVYNPIDGNWTTEISTPRVHALWMLSVRGKTMTGTMVLLPSKTVVRRMELHKDK